MLQSVEKQPRLIQAPAPYSSPENFFAGKEVREWLSSRALNSWIALTQMFQRDSTYFPADKITYHPDCPRLAFQTKPTNIGMGMLVLLGAERLGYLDSRQVDHAIAKMLDSLAGLERTEGLFHDWYDSRDGSTLRYWPDDEEGREMDQFLSSVDNAWLAASLLAVQKAKPHFAQPIQDHILDQMNFEFLFDDDEEVQQYRGGYSASKEEHTSYHYDRRRLSEPRIIPWVHAALTKDPKARRNILSRLLDANGKPPDSLAGGAMFEILMPALFVSEPYLRHAKERALALHMNDVFGRSVTDDPNDGKYKEWGVGGSYTTGSVISAHGAWLPLLMFPDITLENLKKLEERFEGFYVDHLGYRSAVDVENGKTTNSQICVDHAMIFLTILNALDGNYISRMFESHFTAEEINTGMPPVDSEMQKLFGVAAVAAD